MNVALSLVTAPVIQPLHFVIDLTYIPVYGTKVLTKVVCDELFKLLVSNLFAFSFLDLKRWHLTFHTLRKFA